MTSISSTTTAYSPVQHTGFDIDADLKGQLNKIDELGLRTSFKQAQDPIHLAFNYIDKQPLNKIATDFVKDSFFEAVEFITGIFA